MNMIRVGFPDEPERYTLAKDTVSVQTLSTTSSLKERLSTFCEVIQINFFTSDTLI